MTPLEFARAKKVGGMKVMAEQWRESKKVRPNNCPKCGLYYNER